MDLLIPLAAVFFISAVIGTIVIERRDRKLRARAAKERYRRREAATYEEMQPVTTRVAQTTVRIFDQDAP